MLGPLEELSARDDAEPGQSTRGLAEVAHRNGLRLLKLVNTLLDFSSLEAGRLQGRFEPIDIGAYTSELASAFRSAIQQAGLSFIVDTPSGLEAAYIDPSLWEKIVLNLLSNALKFTLQGEITVRLRQVDDMFVLEVRDTGIGIPSEAQPRLFERFYRVEGSRGRTQEGTGIGLALVHDLVKLHGGTIRAESAVGVGTTFIVTIPRGMRHLPSERVVKEQRQVASRIANQFTGEASRWNGVDDLVSVFTELQPHENASSETKKRGCVLLVDDNADMRDYAARLLGKSFDVLTASDGEAAIEVLKHTRPDLILTDVMMPRLDGFGLIRAVRAHPEWRTLPVILLSARAGDEARIEGVSENADDYLVKPFSARELLARVSTHLELARVRRESERKVREADERMRLALQAVGVGTWTWDIDDAVLVADENVFRLFSFTPVADGKAPLELLLPKIHPADLPRIQATLDRVARGEQDNIDEEYRIQQPDGAVRWVESRGHLRFGEKRRLLSGVFIDITERKQLESERVSLHDQVQSTVDRLNFSLESLALGHWSWDVKTDIISCSPRMLDIYGIPSGATSTREELRYKIHPDDRDRAREASRKAIEAKSDYRIEYRVLHPTRGLRWIAATGRPVFNKDRELVGMMGVTQDITERKQAELHLLKQKDVLEQIVVGTGLEEILESLTHWIEDFAERNLTAAVWLVNAEGKSQRFAAGKRIPAAWRERLDGAAISPAFSAATAANKRAAGGVDLQRDPVWEQLKSEAVQLGVMGAWTSPILSSVGEVLGTISIYYLESTAPTSHERDLVEVATRTASIAIERKRAEEALRESRARIEKHAVELEAIVAERTAKLRETIGELEAFSYSISHDMRAPLRSMHGYAELLITEYSSQLSEEGQLYLQRVIKNATRLELLVHDVLAYSKVAKEQVQLTPVSLESFVPSLLEQVQELQSPHIRLNIKAPLPTVLGHEAYLSQIFTNLVSNAVKFARTDVPLSIEISATVGNGMALVRVADNGIGIAPEHFERIFEIFGRVYPDKMYEGTGIGLSIVKKAVHRLGGTVGLESKLGEGSTFWFTLRLA
jgi:PAS domain S-box-containing protein